MLRSLQYCKNKKILILKFWLYGLYQFIDVDPDSYYSFFCKPYKEYQFYSWVEVGKAFDLLIKLSNIKAKIVCFFYQN